MHLRGQVSHYAPLPIPLPIPKVPGSGCANASDAAGGNKLHAKGVSVAVLQEMAKHVPEGG